MKSNDYMQSAFLSLKDAIKSAVDEGDFQRVTSVLQILKDMSNLKFAKEFNVTPIELEDRMDRLNSEEKKLAVGGSTDAKISAIKAFRTRTGQGLKESKDIVEDWLRNRHY